jgi:hypothetical protein
MSTSRRVRVIDRLIGGVVVSRRRRAASIVRLHYRDVVVKFLVSYVLWAVG